ncbi:MAG: tRNA 4-thiouridine(8) synthase ThiI [Desulfobacteraceae bacterium]|nr:tRNA 4-thiouridine(8) synthase ThiI [Desulfobacteraceae bacterium]
MNRKAKGVGLLSGGLDSMLAVAVLREQGIEILGITFITPFFGSGPGLAAGEKLGIEMMPVDISERHFAMLKNPRYGYGGNMNPCIDCHGLMLNEAGKIMEREGGDFLFTGEVLGQRPMSQRRDSLRSVEKLSGYPGLILRPLSAKLLPPTRVEDEGLVDRERLLDIQGRSRKRQVELAEQFGIADYPQPGGGCLLTKEGFSDRLRVLLQKYPSSTSTDAEIIKWGRAFLLPGGSMCMVGRNESDNLMIEKLARPEDMYLFPVDFPGPAGLVISPGNSDADIGIGFELVASYSDAPETAPVTVCGKHRGGTSTRRVEAKSRPSFRPMLLL